MLFSWPSSGLKEPVNIFNLGNQVIRGRRLTRVDLREAWRRPGPVRGGEPAG